MIQLRVLSGKMAGSTVVARHFPFLVGRVSDASLTLEEPGVWDRHFTVQFEPGNGFMAAPQGEALLTINGAAVNNVQRLHNGDSIELGGVRLQFWLGETVQRGYRLRESLVWTGIAALTLGQVALICRLLQ